MNNMSKKPRPKRLVSSVQESLSEILSRRIADKGLGRGLVAARVCAATSELFGKEFAPISFTEGFLKVAVSSDAKAHILRLQEKQIRQKINAVLGQDKILKIKFVVRKRPQE